MLVRQTVLQCTDTDNEAAGRHLHEDVYTLLLLKAANVTEQRDALVHIEAGLRLQGSLRGGLTGKHIALVVLDVEVLVSRRVPLSGVHACTASHSEHCGAVSKQHVSITTFKL